MSSFIDNINCNFNIEMILNCIYCICCVFLIPSRLVGGGVAILGKVPFVTTASVKVV